MSEHELDRYLELPSKDEDVSLIYHQELHEDQQVKEETKLYTMLRQSSDSQNIGGQFGR